VFDNFDNDNFQVWKESVLEYREPAAGYDNSWVILSNCGESGCDLDDDEKRKRYIEAAAGTDSSGNVKAAAYKKLVAAFEGHDEAAKRHIAKFLCDADRAEVLTFDKGSHLWASVHKRFRAWQLRSCA
jgi:hypothetical protein